MKRKVADELNQRRITEIASMWGNTNMDGVEKNPHFRAEAQAELDKNYHNTISILYGQAPPKEEDEIDPNDPFWAAMQRGLDKHKLPEPKLPSD